MTSAEVAAELKCPGSCVQYATYTRRIPYIEIEHERRFNPDLIRALGALIVQLPVMDLTDALDLIAERDRASFEQFRSLDCLDKWIPLDPRLRYP